MGSKFFAKAPQSSAPSQGLEARTNSAAGFAASRYGGAAGKDLGAAMGANNGGGLKATVKDAAAGAPGPKRT